MSIHSSLKISGALKGNRNVWSRIERLVVLKREGRWSEEDSVHGLPKVRTRFKSKTKKQLKAEGTADKPAADAAAAGKAGTDKAATDKAAPTKGAAAKK